MPGSATPWRVFLEGMLCLSGWWCLLSSPSCGFLFQCVRTVCSPAATPWPGLEGVHEKGGAVWRERLDRQTPCSGSACPAWLGDPQRLLSSCRQALKFLLFLCAIAPSYAASPQTQPELSHPGGGRGRRGPLSLIRTLHPLPSLLPSQPRHSPARKGCIFLPWLRATERFTSSSSNLAIARRLALLPWVGKGRAQISSAPRAGSSHNRSMPSLPTR